MPLILMYVQVKQIIKSWYGFFQVLGRNWLLMRVSLLADLNSDVNSNAYCGIMWKAENGGVKVREFVDIFLHSPSQSQAEWKKKSTHFYDSKRPKSHLWLCVSWNTLNEAKSVAGNHWLRLSPSVALLRGQVWSSFGIRCQQQQLVD